MSRTVTFLKPRSAKRCAAAFRSRSRVSRSRCFTALQRPLEQRGGGRHADRGKRRQVQEVVANRAEPGVFQHEALERVDGIRERVHRGNPPHPGWKALLRIDRAAWEI